MFLTKFDKDTGAEDHDPATCLKCLITHSPDTPTIIVTDTNRAVKPTVFTMDCDVSSSLTSSERSNDTPLTNSSAIDDSALQERSMDESNPVGKQLIRKEVMKLIISLSSAVASKSHQQGLVT